MGNNSPSKTRLREASKSRVITISRVARVATFNVPVLFITVRHLGMLDRGDDLDDPIIRQLERHVRGEAEHSPQFRSVHVRS